LERRHERPRSDDASVLYRAPAGPAPSEPEHDRRLPRHVPAAAHVHRRSARQDSQRDPGRRPRRRAHRLLPGPSRARACQQHRHSQRAASGDPLAVQLRRAQAPRARRHDRARARDPTQTRPKSRSSRSYPTRRSTRCWPHRTAPTGPADATTRCC
jgi:hypothetical protein